MRRILIVLSLLAFILIAISTVKFGYDFIFGADTIEGVPKGELIYEIKSPDQLYEAKFYRTSGGATTGYAILGELHDEWNSEPTRIYWDYPREDAEVSWGNNYIIINGVRINLKTEIYDYRYGIYNRN